MHDSDPVAEACLLAQRLADADAPPQEILSCLVSAAEAVAGSGAVSSILVLDREGLLRNGSSPGLPRDYLQAIDGLKPNAAVGTCAAAAATGCVVLTPDFLADGKWNELRHLPMALGFVGAWSMPIKSGSGAVLGTFGTYYRSEREPTESELQAVRSLSAMAARVLDGAASARTCGESSTASSRTIDSNSSHTRATES